MGFVFVSCVGYLFVVCCLLLTHPANALRRVAADRSAGLGRGDEPIVQRLPRGPRARGDGGQASVRAHLPPRCVWLYYYC